MHNKILMNIGFYLLLLFAFAVTVYPPVSYAITIAVFLIWLLDVMIFKETDIFELPLFYPLVGLGVVLMFGWALANIYGHDFPYINVAILAFLYFIVPEFVRTGEQRRMILWTFIAGAMLVTGLHLIYWWATFTNITMRLQPLTEPSLFMVALAFSFLLSFYAESLYIQEKIFLSLVAMPLAVVILLSTDKSVILFFLIIVLLLGIFRDRTIFIPFGLALLFTLSGALGIDYYLDQDLMPSSYKQFIMQPIQEIRESPEAVLRASFFGKATSPEIQTEKPKQSQSFFIDLVKRAGPPAILFFLWALFERAREAYFKHRRLSSSQPRAYHLISLLTIIAIIIMNLYGSVFQYPSIILATWLILGMSQV